MSQKNIINVKHLPIEVKSNAIYSIQQSNTNTYTHGIYKYPCKFISEIPNWCIRKFLSSKKKASILDPFMGSGTTLLEANVQGYDAYGAEIDDISKLISRVKVTKFIDKDYMQLKKIYNRIISKYDNNNIVDVIPKINNIYHWFSKDTINRLAEIKYNINKIKNRKYKDVFDLCFISIIKKVSFADSASPKPYVSKRITKIPKNVNLEFEKSYNYVINSLKEVSKIRKFGKTVILDGDAVSFHTNIKFDLVITSPPYINAFDYVRMFRLENMWYKNCTEDDIKKEKREHIGTESISMVDELSDLTILEMSPILASCYIKILKVDKKRALIVKKYFNDMYKNLKSVFKNLKKHGKYVIVIGNNKIRDVLVENWKILKEISECIGYSYIDNFSYVIKNPYLNIKRGRLGGKIDMDNVLILQK